jgi:hypothetical protein
MESIPAEGTFEPHPEGRNVPWSSEETCVAGV